MKSKRKEQSGQQGSQSYTRLLVGGRRRTSESSESSLVVAAVVPAPMIMVMLKLGGLKFSPPRRRNCKLDVVT